MKKFVFRIQVFLMTGIIMSSCYGVKTGSNGVRPGLVKIFNKGQDSLLCHAGPIEYKSVGNKDHLEMDHTYLKVKNHSNLVVCNFSLITRDETFRPQSVSITLSGKEHNLQAPAKMFAEGYGKKDFVYRYTFSVTDTLFTEWMKSHEPIIKINDRSFKGGRSFRKDAETVYRAMLFDLF